MTDVRSFDPLDYGSLSDSVAGALMDCALTPLESIEPFEGPGIYALFYCGGFPAYSSLVAVEKSAPGSHPIYIGKAAPSTRMGNSDGLLPDNLTGRNLYDRLRQHIKSIAQADNLRVEDFSAKMLVLSYIWVPMAESAMIGKYKPVWNSCIDGFGNHDPGSGRIRGVCSRWDTLHPGRPWVGKFPPRKETQSDLIHEAEQFIDESMN